ncbi:Phage coat protein [Sphingopyxis fribergensis]|uniref:Phage coat protein n=1 Tax=Sphingopyxis fribergensis TaxID=1515612 RepID=A0A0A7PBH5_9SPHN|nr:major capsid protein [Sphingopyxis fribergensis]AJA07451.1 Phage coat protein [Sphingopyxis fribergensis]
MRYFDEALIAAHPRQHGVWNAEVWGARDFFQDSEAALAPYEIANAAAVLPRDAWLDLDGITRRVMRADEGQAWMADLMPLAKPVNIGKLVHLNRVSSDAGRVVRSMSGQVPTTLDKVTYDYRGTPVPIFSSGYGREWREWNTLQSENFDALSDDQEAITAKIKRDNALYALDGDASIVVEGYTAYGIRTSPYSKAINLGTAGGGANIDLSASGTTSDAIEAFFNGPLGAMLDANFIAAPVNLYISPEIARNWDRPYSLAGGFKGGSLRDQILGNRRIAKIEVSFELSGNAFFGFVPRAEYIRPLVAMATSTVAMPRQHPRSNYSFEVWNAMGIEIRADINGRSGVFYSTDIDT